MMVLFSLFFLFLLIIVVFSIDEEREYQAYIRSEAKRDESK